MKKGPNRVLMIWLLVLFGGLVGNAAIFAAPALRHRAPQVSALTYAVFSSVCHQLPERSFFFRGFPLAVCGRCLGIYLGFSAGTILYPFLCRFKTPSLPATPIFVLFSLPIGFDFAGTFLGLWSSPIGLRLAVGLIWGTVLPFYLITGFYEAVQLLIRNYRLKSLAETK